MRVACFLGLFVVAACGARSDLARSVDADGLERPRPGEEVCSGIDEDLDGNVDEDFRDEDGRYVHPDHCGGCGMPCRASGSVTLAAECVVIDGAPVCAATRCAEGFVPSSTGRCVPVFDRLCLPCLVDSECGDHRLARCDRVAGESRCTVSCELGCPEGYACDGDRCAPVGGSCSCEPGQTFDLACALEDPEGMRCPGSARCEDGVLSECAAPVEVCNEVDDDCDGVVDEGYVDERGVYSVDLRNCGECGVDCTLSSVPGAELTCGGDPFAPSCVLRCPDADDGIMPGDRIDADRDIATGCECTVVSLSDEPGPVRTEGPALDPNCDGADGVVVQSFYVAPDGDDRNPGSPTRPLRTINEGLRRASASLDAGSARPHVFVASGSYTETLVLPDGVFVHGGYRRDFLALDPAGFRVDVRAPSDTTAPGGAALVLEPGFGPRATLVEWITLIGRDADTASSAAFGAYLDQPTRGLTIREVEIRAGLPGSGQNGRDGQVGAGPMPAMVGGLPRVAVENASRTCQPGDVNVVRGGAGGVATCDGTNVAGGAGGSPSCPQFARQQPSGERGRGTNPGNGGAGGQDSQGPIMGSGCPTAVCCGLADFSVPTEFVGPQSGENGGAGRAGTGGNGCGDAFGRFDAMGRWLPATATAGTNGAPGAGGGGGGAGGGTVMDFMFGVCEFADGLGGGGGGGGGGGCGGRAGSPGTSGGPSVAVAMRGVRSGSEPTLRDVVLVASDGGRGGDGGAGGDGGRGGVGALGGELTREARSIPSLAGPFPGGRGGRGGDGGAAGGGGGGCGGASVGIWLSESTGDPATFRATNTFRLGAAGLAGQGGAGGAPGGAGSAGGANDVVVR